MLVFLRPPELHSIPGVPGKTVQTTSLRHDSKEGLSELHLATNSTCASGASFHRFPFSEFGLHLSSRSVRTSIECSGSELLLKKAQSSGVLSVSGRRSPSSSLCKRGSVFLLGGCSTPIRQTITISSPPPCATDRYPGDEVLRSWRSSAAHNFPIKLKSREAADVSPNLSSTWARPKLFSREIFIVVVAGGFISTIIKDLSHEKCHLSCNKADEIAKIPNRFVILRSGLYGA
ncbi:hypothetical protein Bca101_012428 [Brassica carinata]